MIMIRDRILSALRDAGDDGLTTEELSAMVGISSNNCSSRLPDLVREGLVRDSGKKRITQGHRHNRRITVWVLVDNGDPAVTGATRFWSDIRRRIKDYMSEGRPVDAGSLEVAYRRFEIDLREIMKRFTDDVNRLKGQESAMREAISRRGLIDACHALQISAPKVGAPVDLALAKRNKRKLVHLYHPDMTSNSNEHTRAMYESVIAAFETVEQYNETLERRDPHVPQTI